MCHCLILFAFLCLTCIKNGSSDTSDHKLTSRSTKAVFLIGLMFKRGTLHFHNAQKHIISFFTCKLMFHYFKKMQTVKAAAFFFFSGFYREKCVVMC